MLASNRVLLTALAALACSFALAAGAAAPARAAVLQNPDAFWQKFTAAVADGDLRMLASLVRKDPEGATWALTQQVEGLSVDPANVDRADKIEKLVKAWSEAFNNKFLDNYYEDLRILDRGQWNDRRGALSRWNKLLALDAKLAKGELEADAYDPMVAESVDLAGILVIMGDRHLAVYCWNWAARASDPAFRSKGADMAKALDYYKKALQLRVDLDFRDSFYEGLYTKVDDLENRVKKGLPPSSGSGGARKEPSADLPESSGGGFAPGSKWISNTTKFIETPPGEIERPNYTCDENYMDWLGVGIEGKENVSGGVQFFATEAKFVRESVAKFLFDPGDKNLVELKLGRPYTFTFKVPLSGGVDYAFCAAMPSDREPAQGESVNAAPNDTRAILRYAPAASRVADLARQKVRLLDDNGDGRYGTEPLVLRDYAGRMEGGLPLMDTMLIGSGKRAVPFSSYVKFGKDWYRLKSDSDGLGQKFLARQAVVPTGKLKFVWKGPSDVSPSFVIVREVGEFAGAYFDLAATGARGLEVPAGDYEFFYGLWRTGKGKQTQKYVIIPMGEPAKIKLAAGGTETLTLGAPFQFAFKASQDGQEVRIAGKSVEIRGGHGERYVLLSDHIPRPEVQVRKPGSRNWDKLGSMKKLELTNTTPIGDLWWPADFAEKKPDPAAMEIRLVDDHKWFGKIESEASR